MARVCCPILGVDVFHPARGSGDAGVVDQHIQTAETRLGSVEKAIHIRAPGDIGAAHSGAGAFTGEDLQGVVIHVADVHPGAVVHKRLGNGAADARGPCRDHDPQALHRYVHADSLLGARPETRVEPMLSCVRTRRQCSHRQVQTLRSSRLASIARRKRKVNAPGTGASP